MANYFHSPFLEYLAGMADLSIDLYAGRNTVLKMLYQTPPNLCITRTGRQSRPDLSRFGILEIDSSPVDRELKPLCTFEGVVRWETKLRLFVIYQS